MLDWQKFFWQRPLWSTPTKQRNNRVDRVPVDQDYSHIFTASYKNSSVKEGSFVQLLFLRVCAQSVPSEASESWARFISDLVQILQSCSAQ